MKYSIKIDFTDNTQKAGKLTLTTDRGEVVINKEPIGIPAQERGEISITSRIEKETYLKKEYLDKNYNYDKAFENIQALGLNQALVIGGNFFISNLNKLSSDKINTVADAFVVSADVFNKLSKISDSDLVSIKSNKVSLLWFPEKVNSKNDSISIKQAVNEFKDTQQVAENLYKNTKAQLFSSQSGQQDVLKEYESSNSKIVKKLLEKDIKNAGKSSASSSYKNKSVSEPSNTRNIINQGSYKKRRGVYVSDDYDNSNDIDAMDILFMYNYPDLAPMYKPNSVLAWTMFFNEQNDNVSTQNIQQSINQVPGFENVGHAEVKYTPSGYSVDMYEDENKANKLGTLNYDGTSKNYCIESPTGHQTNLTINDNGSCTGNVIGGEKATTSFDFVKDSSGVYQGNWETNNNNGIKISSGVSLDESFSPTSSPFSPVDTQGIIKNNEQNTGISFDQSYNNPGFDFSTPKPDVVYEPPPPPPPEVMSWASSSDSYGNTSSFSP